ncbi:polycystin-1-like protein 3 [Lytechinus pictus]|uniref:polycystin-1-like protein 3 n=1 Tax=Lytechinus pictus TaxID=7653 RepID=UPI0030B9FD49
MYKFNNSCYQFNTTGTDIWTAKTNCEVVGFHLVYIETKQEQDFLVSTGNIVRPSSDFWIGIEKTTGGEWVWMDGTVITYSNFGLITRGGECFRLRRRKDYIWADRECNDTRIGYICEKEQGCDSEMTTQSPVTHFASKTTSSVSGMSVLPLPTSTTMTASTTEEKTSSTVDMVVGLILKNVTDTPLVVLSSTKDLHRTPGRSHTTLTSMTTKEKVRSTTKVLSATEMESEATVLNSPNQVTLASTESNRDTSTVTVNGLSGIPTIPQEVQTTTTPRTSSQEGQIAAIPSTISQEEQTSAIPSTVSQRVQTSAILSTIPQEEQTSTMPSTIIQEVQTSAIPSTIPQKVQTSAIPSTIPQEEQTSPIPNTIPPEEQTSAIPSIIPQEDQTSAIPSTIPQVEQTSAVPNTIPPEEQTSTIPSIIPQEEQTSAMPSTIIQEAQTSAILSTIPQIDQTSAMPSTIIQEAQTSAIPSTIPHGEQTSAIPNTIPPEEQTSAIPSIIPQEDQTSTVPSTIPQVEQTPAVPNTIPPEEQTSAIPSTIPKEEQTSAISSTNPQVENTSSAILSSTSHSTPSEKVFTTRATRRSVSRKFRLFATDAVLLEATNSLPISTHSTLRCASFCISSESCSYFSYTPSSSKCILGYNIADNSNTFIGESGSVIYAVF